jgi:hypothetical protein
MPKKPELVLTVKRILKNGLDIAVTPSIGVTPSRHVSYASSVAALPKTIYPRCVSTRPVAAVQRRPIYSFIQISEDLESAKLTIREAPGSTPAPSPTDNLRRKPAKKSGKKPGR